MIRGGFETQDMIRNGSSSSSNSGSIVIVVIVAVAAVVAAVVAVAVDYGFESWRQTAVSNRVGSRGFESQV
jgi:hypothetical protein